jgi:flagellar L-ring protein precursor FlgH
MKTLTIILLFTLLTGCANLLNPPPTRDPAYAPVRPEEMVRAPQNPGAIFQPSTDLRLFEDIRARHIGDILTVRLVETTDAQKKADTNADRSGTTEVTAPVVLGQEAAKLLGYELSTSLSSANKFTGKGTVDQSNSLKGSVTVTVVDVLPNGNLKVQGEKRVGLNQGNEYIKLSGIVRPQDIDTSNGVDSTKIADATMIYNGEGVLADANRMGWLQRAFTSFLFPF